MDVRQTFDENRIKVGRKFDGCWTDVRRKSNELLDGQRSNVTITMAGRLCPRFYNSLRCNNGGWHEMSNVTLKVTVLESACEFRGDGRWQCGVGALQLVAMQALQLAMLQKLQVVTLQACGGATCVAGLQLVSWRHWNSCHGGIKTHVVATLQFTTMLLDSDGGQSCIAMQ